jgi:hypothetical protein
MSKVKTPVPRPPYFVRYRISNGDERGQFFWDALSAGSFALEVDDLIAVEERAGGD